MSKNKSDKCPFCGLINEHSSQCSLPVQKELDVKAHLERQESKRIKDSLRVNNTKPTTNNK